jgi:hypothetical protein
MRIRPVGSPMESSHHFGSLRAADGGAKWKSGPGLLPYLVLLHRLLLRAALPRPLRCGRLRLGWVSDCGLSILFAGLAEAAARGIGVSATRTDLAVVLAKGTAGRRRRLGCRPRKADAPMPGTVPRNFLLFLVPERFLLPGLLFLLGFGVGGCCRIAASPPGPSRIPSRLRPRVAVASRCRGELRWRSAEVQVSRPRVLSFDYLIHNL